MFSVLETPRTTQFIATAWPQKQLQNDSRIQAQPSAFYPFMPLTPSPLQTSRNVNLMPPKENNLIESSPLFYKTPSHSGANDGTIGGVTTNTQFTKPLDESSTPLSFVSPASTIDFRSPSGLNASEATDHQQSKKISTFEARARSSSPASVLSKRTQDIRDGKKTKFLDRIRQRRDEERRGGSVYGDQVLRMDFIRERKEWEEEMARRALDVEGLESDMYSESHQEMDIGENEFPPEPREEEMSPPEEREIEELVEYFGHNSAGTEFPRGSVHQFQQEFQGISDDDEDYDQLFMEVIKSHGNVDDNLERIPQVIQQEKPSIEDSSQMDMS